MSADQRTHTPGPWRAFIGDGNTIAVMKGMRSRKEVIKWTGFDGSDFPQHAVANARLIAAAPDMLTALKELLKAADFVGSGVVDWVKWIDDARALANAAIDKAEGRAESASQDKTP